jgi:hypothetical protein
MATDRIQLRILKMPGVARRLAVISGDSNLGYRYILAARLPGRAH